MVEMRVAENQAAGCGVRQKTVNTLPGAESSCWLSSAASSSVRWGCCQSSASVGGKAHLVANQGRSGFISHYSCGCQSLRSSPETGWELCSPGCWSVGSAGLPNSSLYLVSLDFLHWSRALSECGIFLTKALRLGSSELSETVIIIQNCWNCGLIEWVVF